MTTTITVLKQKCIQNVVRPLGAIYRKEGQINKAILNVKTVKPCELTKHFVTAPSFQGNCCSNRQLYIILKLL